MAQENDALDDLFSYDANLDNVFNVRSADNNDASPMNPPTGATKEPQKDFNVDDEIVITKKRAPVAKLDATRYIEQALLQRSSRVPG